MSSGRAVALSNDVIAATLAANARYAVVKGACDGEEELGRYSSIEKSALPMGMGDTEHLQAEYCGVVQPDKPDAVGRLITGI